jgi:hypothetical protein
MEVKDRDRASSTRSRVGESRPGDARARTGRASPLRGESSVLGFAWRPRTGVDRRTKALLAALLLALLGLACAIWWNVAQFQAHAPSVVVEGRIVATNPSLPEGSGGGPGSATGTARGAGERAPAGEASTSAPGPQAEPGSSTR